MANRFWVGGTGDLSDNTNHWSASSGGSPGASLPGVGDNIIFDSNAGGGTVTVESTMTVQDMNQTNDAAISQLARTSGVINVQGDAHLKGISTGTGAWKFDTQAGQTSFLTYEFAASASPAIFGGNIDVAATGTVQLGPNWGGGGISGSFQVQNGTFNIADETFRVTGGLTIQSGAGLKWGSGILRLLGTSTILSVNSNATITKGTGIIRCEGNNASLVFGAHDYYDLELLADNLKITDCGSSFNRVLLATGNNYQFAVCAVGTPTVTADSLDAPGTIDLGRYLGSGNDQWTIDIPDFDFDEGTITNGNSLNSVQVQNATDGGNNTNFQFGGGTREDYQNGAAVAFLDL